MVGKLEHLSPPENELFCWSFCQKLCQGVVLLYQGLHQDSAKGEGTAKMGNVGAGSSAVPQPPQPREQHGQQNWGFHCCPLCVPLGQRICELSGRGFHPWWWKTSAVHRNHPGGAGCAFWDNPWKSENPLGWKRALRSTPAVNLCLPNTQKTPITFNLDLNIPFVSLLFFNLYHYSSVMVGTDQSNSITKPWI